MPETYDRCLGPAVFQARRVLAPGGWLLFTTSAADVAVGFCTAHRCGRA